MRFFQFSKLKKALQEQEKHSTPTLSTQDRSFLQTISKKTQELNQNNVTRTQAYLDYYQKHPEIQWTFLAHMVSRNAGWNMTDLQGEFLPKLLSPGERNDFFHMLERGNWLIFQDAYPQLLLYEESKKRRNSLFYLLPYFDVSVFMKTMWEEFLKNRDSKLLTKALIINEQNYIEERVIQNSTYQQSVFDTLEFQLQDVLSMNQMLFPLESEGEITLVGDTVHHFSSLARRIQFGKRLYSLLFSDDHLPAILDWAKRHPHTGSRQDFWKVVFCDKKEAVPGKPYPPRFKNCAIPLDEPRFYSPGLFQAWEDVEHPPPQKGDWYENPRILVFLKDEKTLLDGEIKAEYCQTLERLDWIISTKNLLFPRM